MFNDILYKATPIGSPCGLYISILYIVLDPLTAAVRLRSDTDLTINLTMNYSSECQ